RRVSRYLPCSRGVVQNQQHSGSLVSLNSGEKRPCQSNAHVCTSLMRYADGTEVNEGPYCLCDGCGEKWRECDPGDLAVTMGTSTSEWSPHVREARCSCPENTYQLLGWWRHPTSKHNNRTGQWIYEYFCEKGFKCPDRDDEDDKELLESDHRGIYVARYCQETHSYFKR
ncbi:hypothetical protein MAR_032182, partial [Mya arenaria]